MVAGSKKYLTDKKTFFLSKKTCTNFIELSRISNISFFRHPNFYIKDLETFPEAAMRFFMSRYVEFILYLVDFKSLIVKKVDFLQKTTVLYVFMSFHIM